MPLNLTSIIMRDFHEHRPDGHILCAHSTPWYSVWGPLPLESCGARFLAPRPRIAPLSFAPTRTGPKNSKFYGPDPGPTRLYFPRTGPKQFGINPKLSSFDLNRTENSEVYGKYFSFKSSFRLQ